jgi:dye decolorizing peroxidase
MTDTAPNSAAPEQSPPGLRRRSFLGLLGAGAAGVAVGVGGTAAVQASQSSSASTAVGTATVPFYGDYQAGIATPAQARAELVAFDLASGAGLAEVRTLMQRWTSLAAALTIGAEHPDDPIPQLAANPASLTLTVGFGPRLFVVIGRADQRPAGVSVFPPFAKDELDPAYSGGDLLIQACSEDAVAASHAVEALTAAAAGIAAPRWRQAGFQRTPGVAEGETARNLMGQKDGTANDAPDSERFAATVWAAGPEYPAWYVGGTTLVLRRIRMDLQSWAQSETRTRERIIGRHLDTGAPLGETDEFAPVPLNAQTPEGQLQIPSSSHVRIAHPDTNSGARMVRRGYNYTEAGESGLLFIALQADATRGFIPVMSRMASGDDLNRFVTHVGSAVFALPPGVREGEYWGEGLLA